MRELLFIVSFMSLLNDPSGSTNFPHRKPF